MPDVRGAGEVQVRGRHNATPPALNDQDTSELQLDAAGNLLISLLTAISLQGSADGSTLNAVVRKINAENALITHDVKVRDALDELLLTVKTALSDIYDFDLSSSTDSGDEGALSYRRIATADTNADVVAMGVANLNGWYIFNNSASTKFVKLFNLSRQPVIGTGFDKPFLTIPIPAGGVANVLDEDGIFFSQGIAISITGAAADSDATNLTAGDVIVNLFYTFSADEKTFFTYRTISLATTNADVVSMFNSNLCGYYLFNTSGSTKFVKFYNLNRAPVVGTDKPLLTLPLVAGGGSNLMDSSGVYFPQGIAIAITGAAADADTTAVAAGDVIANVFYRPLQEIGDS